MCKFGGSSAVEWPLSAVSLWGPFLRAGQISTLLVQKGLFCQGAWLLTDWKGNPWRDVTAPRLLRHKGIPITKDHGKARKLSYQGL